MNVDGPDEPEDAMGLHDRHEPKWPIPGSKPGRTRLLPPVRFRMVIDTQRTSLSKDEVLQILSQVRPNAVDQFTPQGRLPSQQELAQLIG